MTAIFVTATGTDIGKTFVTAGLIRHLRAAGHAVDALKPVATGFDSEEMDASDPGLLLAALGQPVTLAAVERMAPFRYVTPLSPDMAARRERRPLEFDALVDFCRRAIAAQKDTLLIEGVGGVMVPLDARHTVLDWMAALNLPLLLVAGSYLGTISHTLTALDALKRRKLTVKALILNETPGSAVPVGDAMVTLTSFATGIPIVPLPRLQGAATHSAFAKLAALL